jgi:anion-transporting  ArsA/GET3 family ATPase
MGSGGVGKTTVAASLGVLAARRGQKVLVLTIDPSQRLKTTLGLPDSGEIVEIQNEVLCLKEGHLFGAVINAKSVFDQFVQRAVESAGLPQATAQKIMRNKLYIQLSTTLSGSQEFTALEKLFSSYKTGEFDLIVLDTPPAHHAVEFLRAPQKLAALFNDKIAQWFRSASKAQGAGAFFQQILNAGTTQVIKTLELLTGSEFIRELSEFFQNIELWQGRLEERVSAVQRLLSGADTSFALVTNLDSAKLKEAEYFSKEVYKSGYRLKRVFVNKAYPLWLESNLKVEAPLAELYEKFENYEVERKANFISFESEIKELCPATRLPEFAEAPSDLEGIVQLADYIAKHEVPL